MLLLGIAATNSVTGKEDDGHKIKQAVNCMCPDLLLNNVPAPPALNFVHILMKNINFNFCLLKMDKITVTGLERKCYLNVKIFFTDKINQT